MHLAALLVTLLSQAPQEVVIHSHAYTPPSTLAAETNLVESMLVVRDAHGQPQGGFHASDFQVLDNGKPKPIISFSESTAHTHAAPKSVTLFFDDLHTGSGPLGETVVAARKFVATSLTPADQISIASSSGSFDLDFTNDAPALETRFNQIRSNTRPIPPSRTCPPNRSVRAHAEIESKLAVTALNDSLHRLSARSGTRVMVLVSSGFLPPPQRELEAVISTAVRGNITVHALDTKSLDTKDFAANSMEEVNPSLSQLRSQVANWSALEKLADRSGGYFFHGSNDLEGAIRMAASPSVTYALAFNPIGRDGQFHDLKIAFANKSPYSLQFRPGYFSALEETREPTVRTMLDAAVFSKDTIRQLRTDVSSKPAPGAVSVAVTLDMNPMEFKTVNGRHVQQIVFLLTLLDPQGAFVSGKEAVMDLALTDEKLASLQKEGLRAMVTLNAPAGVYQLRTIIREASTAMCPPTPSLPT